MNNADKTMWWKIVLIGVLVEAMSPMMASCSRGRPGPYVPPVPTEAERAWERAMNLERQGNFPEALAAFLAICDWRPAYERACYDYSRLLFRDGQIAKARVATFDFVSRFPENALAPSAVKRLGRRFAKEELDAGIEVLLQLAREVEDTSVWDSVLFALADCYRRDGQVSSEKKILEDIVDLGRWGSSLWDDALWRLVEMARSQKRQGQEVRLLKKMIAAKERSWWIASYHSPYMDKAMFRLGELYMERAQWADAKRTFRSLYKWRTSRLRDDALVMSARVERARENYRKACRYLERTLSRFPDSNGAKDARRLQSLWGCHIERGE